MKSRICPTKRAKLHKASETTPVKVRRIALNKCCDGKLHCCACRQCLDKVCKACRFMCAKEVCVFVIEDRYVNSICECNVNASDAFKITPACTHNGKEISENLTRRGAGFLLKHSGLRIERDLARGFRRIAPSPTSGKLIKLFAQRSWRSCGQIQERPTEGLLRQLSAHAGIVDTLHGVSKILPFQERMQLTASLRFAGCAFTSLTTNPLPINLKGMSSTAAVSTNGQNSCLRNQGAICQ